MIRRIRLEPIRWMRGSGRFSDPGVVEVITAAFWPVSLKLPVPSRKLRRPMRTHYDAHDLDRMTAALASSIAATCAKGGPVTVVGIRTRGHLLADRIAARLLEHNCLVGRGVLDITLYRDDLSEIGPRPVVRPTRMDVDIDGKPLFLIDDVLFTGRTVRAALNALADFGRPSAIRLAVLVDRGGRELPIQSDFTGFTQTDVPVTHRVKVKLVESDGIDEIVIEPRTAR